MTSLACRLHNHKLVNASLNGQLIQSNLYDGSGERLMATVNGSSVVYAYEGNNILYEKNMTTGAVTDHFYVGRLQLAKLSSSVPYYYHFDALGSIRLVTDFGGINAFSTNYLPYGIAYNTTGMETFMYTDKPVDSSTGLYYFGARFYDVSLFRFMSRDSDSGSIDYPLSLNLYVCARDNPQRYVDTTGHSPVFSNVLMRTDIFTPLSWSEYLSQVYWPEHLGDLLLGICGVVLAFLGPAIVAVLGGPDNIIVGARCLVAADLALDLPVLCSDLGKNNYAALGTDIVTLVADVIKGYLQTLSPLQLLEIGLMTVAQDAGSLGWGAAVQWLVGAGAILVLAGAYFANFWYEYNYVYLKGEG